jgi:plastocyanin
MTGYPGRMACGIASAIAVSVAGLAAVAQPAAPTVQIHNFMFGPMAVTVTAGQAVTFVNTDEEPHTVAATDHSWRSPPLDTNQRFTHVFAAPGQYRYFCSIHPQMTGLVIVRPIGASGPPRGGH